MKYRLSAQKGEPAMTVKVARRRGWWPTLTLLAMVVASYVVVAHGQPAPAMQRVAGTYSSVYINSDDGVWEYSSFSDSVPYQVGMPARAIYGGGLGLFATDQRTGDIYEYLGSPMSWGRIGGPGREFVVGSNELFGLNDQGVWQWTGGTNWIKIGGPAAHIYGGILSDQLLATDINTGEVYLYDGARPGGAAGWQKIGGPGRSFLAVDNFYFVGLNDQGVWQWTGGTNWAKIGNPAGRIFDGRGGLLATDATTGDVYQYHGSPFDWGRIGGPGLKWVGANLPIQGYSVFGLGTDSGVSRYDGAGWLFQRYGYDVVAT
jgi:hypothetical protein